MFVIIGLGNPGLAYAYTRHNVGFLLVDHLAYSLGFPEFTSKFDSLCSEKSIDSLKIMIQKPQTFMNLSGRAVFKLVSFYKILTENIFVVHDDIDLEPLKVRIKFSGSSGGHNGIKDIDKYIGNNYWRIKIGVGRPQSKEQVAAYVLSSFYKDEITSLIQDVFSKIINNIPLLLSSENKKPIINNIVSEINKPC
jgi:PTH1 family peptidyl-tRNA hydrolase